MADLIDQEAKRRGVSREALIAFYHNQQRMTGQNGTDNAQPAQRTPAAQPQPRQDNRGPLQRLLDALGGNPNGN
jgi:hypothetical protein